MDSAPDDDDARRVELETLEAIYPEIRRPLGNDAAASRFTFELELPVRPAEPVTVLFPAVSASRQDEDEQLPGAATEPVDSLLVSHLPPIALRVTLPDGYPETRPPQVAISTTPQWLSPSTLASLEDDGPRLWQEAGRDLVVYSFIDHVQRAAEHVFGAITARGTLEVDAEHKLAVLDYDIKANKAAFDRETFECGVCLDPKKGSSCHKMLACGHVFCLQCLRDFYNDAIESGNLSTVRCLTPNCAKERAAAQPNHGNSSRHSRTPRLFVSPSELLQMGLSEDTVKRYVTLKYKTELESDKDTIYCPRQWCNGAARSKKHKKPEGLEFAEASDVGGDSEQESADEGGQATNKFNPADLLCVCEDCGFAFCSRCLQTWHGEFVRCTPKRNKDELTEEEKASLEYLQLHTSPCPTCNAPAQKTHGCNHMICSRCDTHFCYLCSSWLDPANPYQHYNQQQNGKVTSCHMRLWELEGGDGDDVGQGFVGGRGAGAYRHGDDAEFMDERLAPELEAQADSESEGEDDAAGAQQEAGQRGEPVAVAREAPLVLRLVDNQPRAGGRRGGRDQPGQPAAAQGAAPPPPPPAAAGAAEAVAAAAPGAGRGRGQNQPPRRRARRGGVDAARGRGEAAAAAARGARGRGARGGRGGGVEQHAAQEAADADLNPAQAEWLRRFVRLALMDAEDEVEGGDSDSDDGNWRIR